MQELGPISPAQTANRLAPDDSDEYPHHTGAIKPILADWSRRYGYRSVRLESSVESHRFKGTSYKAANWI
jgi:hypothetical protein